MQCAALTFVLVLVPSAVLATDLRITDSKGTEVVVASAIVDYGSMMTADADKDGIRVQQGDGVVRLKWQDVDSVAILKVDTSVKPARIDLDVVLRNGSHVPATLFRKGAMTLSGRSDLGDYVIDLEKIRRIVPVR